MADRDFREVDEPPPPATIPPAVCRCYSDALADVLCWFSGFAAARPEANLPPGLETLREMNIFLKGHY